MIPRLFVLRRYLDESGVSGTGVVADGVQFGDGTVVIRWLSVRPSTVVWASLDDAMAVHGHNGRTRVVWNDDDAEVARLRTYLITIRDLHAVHDDHCADSERCDMAGACQCCERMWPCGTRRNADTALDGGAP